MSTPIARVKEFITALRSEYNLEFVNTLPSSSMQEGMPNQERMVEHNESVREFQLFMKFHDDVAKSDYETTPCQCTLIQKAREFLSKKLIPFDEFDVCCECGESFVLPVPKAEDETQHETGELLVCLVDGDFDYLFTSKLSVPSPDQPGHGGCLCSGLMRWTWDARALEKINDAYSKMGFPQLCKMSDTHTRMLLSLHSHNFISGDICYDVFKDVFGSRIDSMDKAMTFDSRIIDENEFSPLVEWMLIAIAKHVAGDDVALLAKMRRDIQCITPKFAGLHGNPRVDMLGAAAFVEILYPVKFAIFTVNFGLQLLYSSDSTLFEKHNEEEGSGMNPVILNVLVLSANHLDKTVMQPCKGTFIKGVDKKLPGWLEAAGNRSYEVGSGSVAEMIRNWNDGKDDIFDFRQRSIGESQFKASVRGQWIEQLPKFAHPDQDDSLENLTNTAFTYSPMGLLLNVIMRAVDVSDVGDELCKWVSEHQDRTNLIGCEAWDERWTPIVGFEMFFIYIEHEKFFSAMSDKMVTHDQVAEESNWELSMFLDRSSPSLVRSKKRMLAELANHLQATPKSAIKLRIDGMGKSKERTGDFTCVRTGGASDAKLSCAVFAMETLFKLITGKSVLAAINDQFPLLNNAGVSFGMLTSVKALHEKIDWSFLPVDSTKQGSKVWMIKLFRECPVGFYWVQVDLKKSINIAADHVLAVQIVQDWKQCTLPKQRIAVLMDNSGRTCYVEREDVEDALDAEAGERIFNKFMNCEHIRLTSIVRLKCRTRKNSTYQQARATEQQLKNRRLTRQLSTSSSSVSRGRFKKKGDGDKATKKTGKTLAKCMKRYANVLKK